MVEIAQAQPAEFFFDSHAMQAERAHRLPQFAGEAVFGVDRGGQRGDLLVGKAAGGLADHLGVFIQAEIEFGGCTHGFVSSSRPLFSDGHDTPPGPTQEIDFRSGHA